MALSLASRLADLRRQFRLLARHVRYPGFTKSGRKSRAVALENLFLGVNAWLQESGAEYFLVYGTLLGWHREGRILGHDRDIDFGLPRADYPRLIAARKFLPEGFELWDTSWRQGGPKLYVTYRGWEADLYFFAEQEGRMRVILESDLPGDRLPFPRELLLPRQPATFLGAPTFVPAQPSAYLEHLYRYTGPDAELDPDTHYYRPRRTR